MTRPLPVPRDGRRRSEAFSRAMELHEAGRYDDAIAAFEQARDLGHAKGISAYNIACGHARLGRADEAMEWLATAVAEGFDVAPRLHSDQDLASLRRLPGYPALRSARTKSRKPARWP